MQYHTDQSQQDCQQETGSGHDLLTAGLMVVVFAAFAFAPARILHVFDGALASAFDWMRALPREAVIVGVPFAVFMAVAIEKAAKIVRRGLARRGGAE